jgi:hypothetical protein
LLRLRLRLRLRSSSPRLLLGGEKDLIGTAELGV